LEKTSKTIKSNHQPWSIGSSFHLSISSWLANTNWFPHLQYQYNVLCSNRRPAKALVPRHVHGPIEVIDFSLQTWREGTWGPFRTGLSTGFLCTRPLLVSAFSSATSTVPCKAGTLQITDCCSICSIYICRKQLCSRAFITGGGCFLAWNPVHT